MAVDPFRGCSDGSAVTLCCDLAFSGGAIGGDRSAVVPERHPGCIILASGPEPSVLWATGLRGGCPEAPSAAGTQRGRHPQGDLDI